MTKSNKKCPYCNEKISNKKKSLQKASTLKNLSKVKNDKKKKIREKSIEKVSKKFPESVKNVSKNLPELAKNISILMSGSKENAYKLIDTTEKRKEFFKDKKTWETFEKYRAEDLQLNEFVREFLQLITPKTNEISKNDDSTSHDDEINAELFTFLHICSTKLKYCKTEIKNYIKENLKVKKYHPDFEPRWDAALEKTDILACAIYDLAKSLQRGESKTKRHFKVDKEYKRLLYREYTNDPKEFIHKKWIEWKQKSLNP